MAKKISQLTQATEVKSDDVTVIVQDGETKKLPLNMMVTKQDIENKKVAGLAKLDEIEATYENDTYTPTITVKNKSSVKTGEGDEVDYSANVMDGHVKSAILKGQTLVNIASQFKVVGSPYNNNIYHVEFTGKELLQNGKTYTFFSKFGGLVSLEVGNDVLTICSQSSSPKTCHTINGSIGRLRFFRSAQPSYDVIYQNGGGQALLDDLVIIEGDWTNVDIPYFEGMQSVKMPVLTTTGKNLSPINDYETTVCEYANGHQGFNKVLAKNILVNENKEYHLSFTKECEDGLPTNLGNLMVWFSSIPVSSNIDDHNSVYTHCQNNKGKKYAHITMPNIGQGNEYVGKRVTLTNIQLEEGSVATSYEPYKSNILTVNEDVVLRGIGDVRDELSLMTGELTQRIGEFVLDGSEEWHKWGTDSFLYRGSIRVNETNSKILSDKLPVVDYDSIYSCTTYGIGSRYGNIGIRINNVASVEDLKMFLSQNPITVQYHLETESIKTVDLMPSGTHPSTTPYCWKNGHIQLSSSGLLPNLEYSVVTSRAGQINQNATMIVKNDKRIFDLEILLAGGLVNTTYQALTLQNQVETGLSKVSLNSETEPDYLLYHMIMKLIEEKAYKLDDLTEKVSVFYLYEKLSDEQFETIYSALYPFVEDEIVEEPVVEELPEVVEDEVIM